jgi:hypothetical protein
MEGTMTGQHARGAFWPAFLLGTFCYSAAPAQEPAELPGITVYKHRACHCCARWVEHLRKHGFAVHPVDTSDMEALVDIKAIHGVGEDMLACHTATAGRFVIEGHVPAGDIKRLLREDPNHVEVLAVPGMPGGAPGMEEYESERYTVFAVDPDGNASRWAEH